MGETTSPQQSADTVISGALQNSLLWRVKLRLQFTGWLQFIPCAVAGLFCLLVAGVGWLLAPGSVPFFWVPFVLGVVFFVVLAFDIGTVKLGLHPVEALPTAPTDVDAFDLMRERHSCRSFQARDLTAEHRAELLEAVERHSRQECLIGDRPIRFEYVAAPLIVWPVMGAREFLVAIAPAEYDRTAVLDVGRSLQKVVLDATRMGLATCWIGPGADQQSVSAHLGDRHDPEVDHVICVCAVGYESRFKPLAIRLIQRAQQRRLPLASLFFADSEFAVPLDVEVAPFVTYGRCYEVCQWSPSSFNSQTTRCVAVAGADGGVPRPVRFDFCSSTNSQYYAPVAVGIWCANWEAGCEALGLAGQFAMLSAEERGISDAPEFPRYDVSWMVAPE